MSLIATIFTTYEIKSGHKLADAGTAETTSVFNELQRDDGHRKARRQ